MDIQICHARRPDLRLLLKWGDFLEDLIEFIMSNARSEKRAIFSRIKKDVWRDKRLFLRTVFKTQRVPLPSYQ